MATAAVAAEEKAEEEEEGAAKVEPPLPLRIIESLVPHESSGLCEQIFEQKTMQQQERDGIYAGAPSLRSLLDVDNGEMAFGMYAESACEELADALRSAAPPEGSKREKATYISVIGHGGFNHAVAYAAASAAGMRACDLDKMLNLELGDVEAVLVPLYGDGKVAIHLKRPK